MSLMKWYLKNTLVETNWRDIFLSAIVRGGGVGVGGDEGGVGGGGGGGVTDVRGQMLHLVPTSVLID